jgi:hypothetical protein
MLFEEPAPRLLGDKWGTGPKKEMRARVSTFVLGACHSQPYEFDRNKNGNFKNHSLTNEFGICRTRVIYALAGGERGHEKNAAFRRDS